MSDKLHNAQYLYHMNNFDRCVHLFSNTYIILLESQLHSICVLHTQIVKQIAFIVS